MYSHEMHKPLLLQKPGAAFIDGLSFLERPWSSARSYRAPRGYVAKVFYEFPCADMAAVRSPQMDALVHISYQKGSLYYNDSCLVAIEIKTDKDDLRHDEKYTRYLGYSDYLYFAVTTDLVDRAVKKVIDNPFVGVFDISTGVVYKVAMRQPLSLEQRLKVYDTMVSFYRLNTIPEKYFHLGASLFELSDRDDENSRKVLYHLREDLCWLMRAPDQPVEPNILYRFVAGALREDAELLPLR